MSGEMLCDQCGCPITEEDIQAGRALKDQRDCLCAECAEMYAEEEAKVRMRDRMGRAAAAVAGTPKRSISTVKKRSSTGRRSTSRATNSRRSQKSSNAVFYAVAAALVAVAVGVAVVMLHRQEESDAPSTEPAPAPVPAVIVPATTGPAATAPTETGPVQPPPAVDSPPPDPEEDEPPRGGLFAPILNSDGSPRGRRPPVEP